MKQDKSFKVFIALFDYDPYKMSPNQDSVDEELPFKEGQLIKVYGNPDADGYYYGECNGRFGFIPGNMISEVDDPEIVRQLMNETGDDKKKKATTGKAISGGPQQAQMSTAGVSSSAPKQKTSKPSTQTQGGGPKSKEQSFQPISNYNNQYKQPQGQNRVVMVALYDYDPQSLSPNADTDVNI